MIVKCLSCGGYGEIQTLIQYEDNGEQKQKLTIQKCPYCGGTGEVRRL